MGRSQNPLAIFTRKCDAAVCVGLPLRERRTIRVATINLQTCQWLAFKASPYRQVMAISGDHG